MNPTISSYPDAAAATTPKPRVARWRWWLGTTVIAAAPVLASISSAQRSGDSGPMLPSGIWSLTVFCVLQMVAFGLYWAIAWGLACPSKEELLLNDHRSWDTPLWRAVSSILLWFPVPKVAGVPERIRNAWKTPFTGLVYSVVMRFGVMIFAIAVFILLAMFGFDPKKLAHVVSENGQGTTKAFAPAVQHGSLLYKVLMFTLLSFVVAGLREELWRTFTMAGMKKLSPEKWSETQKNVLAVALSSFLFSMGHIYQGATGVVTTGLLGILLGTITLTHKSAWPAVFAHGFFDATSFALLAIVTSHGGLPKP